MNTLSKPPIHLLPQPFDWCFISAGTIVLKQYTNIPSGEVSVDDFYIATYPITCGQYDAFIADGGYDTPQLWTATGWTFRQQHDWQEPNAYKRYRTYLPNHPVQYVSWYEAVAFCNWLDNRLRIESPMALYRITLPTEAQWQRAAQGDDDRLFPWGNTFDRTRANTIESEPQGAVTEVTHYEGLGDSPYGVVDMCGNVPERCLNEWLTGSTELELGDAARRAVRGGGRVSQTSHAETTYRMYPMAHTRGHGFRLCANPIVNQ